MKIRFLHSWDLTPREAVRLQQRLSAEVEQAPLPRRLELVAGADCAVAGDRLEAVVVVLTLPGLEVLETRTASAPLSFPYIPGLLSFRECPALLKAFSLLAHEPDVVFFDGHGYAHPRRLGLASHMGLWLRKPAIGCAKSVLCGRHGPFGAKKGATAPLIDRGEVVGAAVRTRDDVHPVYVSVGHLVTLKEAVDLTLRCCDGFRIPKPTREADRLAGLRVPVGARP